MSGTGTGVASYGDLLVTSLVVLVGVCIAAFVIVRVFGRLLATGRTRGAHLLDVVARVPLEPRRSLYVVEVAGKTLLVGTSEMGLSVLTELDGSEVRSRVSERPTFGELVKQAWSRRKGLGRSEAASMDAASTEVASTEVRSSGAASSGAPPATASSSATAASSATDSSSATEAKGLDKPDKASASEKPGES